VVVGIAFAADPERAAVERDAATLMRVAMPLRLISERVRRSRVAHASRLRYAPNGASMTNLSEHFWSDADHSCN
jgi:hypothetical protein